MACPITSLVDMIASQNPSLLGAGRAMGEVDQAALAVPDIFAVRRHAVSEFDRYALPDRHVIDDKDLLAGWAAC